MLERAIELTNELRAALVDAQAELTQAETALAAELPTSPADAEQEQAVEHGGHDNSLPFKCPACGRTYHEQVVCQHGHAPEATLPTADVLAGAAPAAPGATIEPVANQDVTETGTTAAEPPAVPDPLAAAPADGSAASGTSSSSSTTAPDPAAPAAPGPQWPEPTV